MDGVVPESGSPRTPFIGRALPRFEDLRFLRGRGRYTDDHALPGQVYAAFVRSPHAHAVVRGIDMAAARGMPGVLAALTGADYLSDGCGGIEQVPIPADAVRHADRAFVPVAGRPIADIPHLPLAVDRVRYLGEPVAVVIAETAETALDAAEAVDVDYEPRPALVDVLDAVAPGAPVLWPDMADNVAVAAEFGDRSATADATSAAEVVVEQVFRNQRIANAQMEPRSAIGVYDAAEDLFILISGSQGAQRQKAALASTLKVPAERIRVVCPDVGGGFGPRSNLSPEQAVVVWGARRVGRPVKWTSNRSEAFLTDYQGRDLVTTARLALDGRGRIRALSVDLLGNVGAHTVSYVPLSNGYRVLSTVYHVPTAHVSIRGVLTNTVPTAPYRGAGRPEATYAIERLLDIAARRLGLDRAEIRRRNLVRREQLPYRNVMGLTYDSGDFAGNMQRALDAADWVSFPERRAAAAGRGRLAGIGFANYVESPVGAPHERVEVTVRPDGIVEAVAGTQSTGQGHETSFAQVLADRLGVLPEQVRLVTGDTAVVRSGGGTHSDRSMRLGGTLIVDATSAVVAQAKRVVAALLEVGEAEIVFEDGLFSASRSNRRLTLFDVARAIDEGTALPEELRRTLSSVATFTGRIPAYPTGAAVCEVEVDPDTGVVDIRRYTSVDDAGQPINPLILHGQTHGGIAQGVGQALCEGVVLDRETGQVLSGSFMDYAMPRADMLPFFAVELTEDPTAGNPLRVKGGGEGGITPALATVMNAVVDALSVYGIEHLDMPATPYRIWSAIRQARENGQAR